MSIPRPVLGLFPVLVAASTAAAQLHSGDILLTVANGRITTGAVDQNGQPVAGQRVFLATFGNLGANATNNPGFDSTVGVFTPGTANGFRLLGPLRLWSNGNYNTIPDERVGVTLSIFPPLGPVTTPLTDTPVTGFTVQVLSAGDWHHHLEYNLLAPADAGIYLLEMSIFSTDSAVADSPPLWLVLNKSSTPADHQAAFVEARYVFAREGCAADWNRDHAVQPADVASFVNQWFGDLSGGGLLADINGDGQIAPADVAQFVNLWFTAVASGC